MNVTEAIPTSMTKILMLVVQTNSETLDMLSITTHLIACEGFIARF
jgi:hypothetical protein